MDPELEPTEPIEQTPEPTEPPQDSGVPTPRESTSDTAFVEKRMRELQGWSDDLARRERALQERQPAADEDDPLAGLDPEARRLLDVAMERKLQETVVPQLQQQQAYQLAVADQKLKAFAAANGLDEEAVGQTVYQHNLLQDLTPGGIDSALESAKRIMTASAFDPDRERERIKEELIREMAEKGEVIAGVPKPTGRGDTGQRAGYEALRDDATASGADLYRAACEHVNRR